MKKSTARKLLALNREFYQTFATPFSATRGRLQPGVMRILKNIPSSANILDLGCGNGELARALAYQGHQGEYLGLDFSAELLAIVRESSGKSANFRFIQADLAAPDWEVQVSNFTSSRMTNRNFDIVLAFAVLHHLPGSDLHNETCQKIHGLLVPGGRFIHSNWQFLNSNRLRKRIQPWEEIDLTPEDVGPGDYLLDWRQGGRGLRYVHHFDPDALVSLSQKTGFGVIDSFYSDGEGGNLGLYQVWEKWENDR